MRYIIAKTHQKSGRHDWDKMLKSYGDSIKPVRPEGFGNTYIAIVRMDAATAEQLKKDRPDLVVEKDIRHAPASPETD